MPKIPPHMDGAGFVDCDSQVFEDVTADEGERARITFHTMAFEGSIGLANSLDAIPM